MADLSLTTNPPAPPTTPQNLPFWQRVTLRQVAIGTALVALTLVAGTLLVALRYVFILLFFGIVVATALAPIADRLRRWNVGRGVSALVAFALLLLIVAGIIAALTPFFVEQLGTFAVELPDRYANLRASLTNSPSQLLREGAALLPENPFSGANGGAALGQLVGTYLPELGRGLLFTALVLLISYYWLYYRALAIQSIALLIPIDRREAGLRLWDAIEFKIGAFVRGMALLSVSIGVLSGVGYALVGVPYALTLGIIAGVLEAVPYVGPLLTMVISVVVGLSVSPTTALMALGVGLAVQFIENSIIVPRVMDRAVGVNPIVTLLALTIFADLFGLLGALLAVPLAAALQVLLDRMVMRDQPPEELQLGGRDQFALLRYRTRDLATDLRQRVRSKTEEISAEEDAVEEQLEALLLDLDGLLAAEQERQAT
ncbi:MAG: hypothetical protein OHK0022_25390 [Roseiflexaceae bacterium]